MTRQLLFNNAGMLLMSNKEINLYHKRAINELRLLTPNECRLNQYERYCDFIEKALGFDITINPKLDPFFELTGYPIKVFALDKWKYVRSEKGYYAQFSGLDLISEDYFSSLEKYSGRPELQWYKDYYKNGAPARCRARKFAPIVMNKEHDWKMHFSTIDYAIFNSKKQGDKKYPIKTQAWKGVLIIQPEPLSEISKNPHFKQLYKMLLQIGEWFSHDYTGHATLDFMVPIAPENYRYKKIAKKNLEQFEILYARCGEKGNLVKRSLSCDENRKLLLHHELAEIFFSQNPKLKKYLYAHVSKYYNLLVNILHRNEGLSWETTDYFIKVYLFCLLRIMPIDEVLSLCKKEGVQYCLYEYWELNPLELEIHRIISWTKGAPFNKLGLNASDEQWSMKNLKNIPHKVFFEHAHKRMFPKKKTRVT